MPLIPRSAVARHIRDRGGAAPRPHQRALRAAGAPVRPAADRYHDLRHGAATLSLAAGVDIKIVQEMLGHSTSSFTRDVYTSVVPEIATAAAEAVAAIVPRRGRTEAAG